MVLPLSSTLVGLFWFGEGVRVLIGYFRGELLGVFLFLLDNERSFSLSLLNQHPSVLSAAGWCLVFGCFGGCSLYVQMAVNAVTVS